MAFLHWRRAFTLYLLIGIVSFICFFLIVQDYQLGNVHVAEKVMSWIRMKPAKKVVVQEPPSSIFFAETSRKSYLEAREACSMESAALHHPRSNVTLFTIGSIAPDDVYLTILQNMSNFRVKHLNLSELFHGTPLAMWYHLNVIQDSVHPIEHMSDAVRLAILWKFGGMYLDTDVIVIKSFDGVRNALALQDIFEANGAIMVFDRNSSFLSESMEDYVMHFSALDWANQGPALVTRILKSFCKTENLQRAVNNPSLCEGVTLLPQESFYPIAWPDWPQLFQPAEEIKIDPDTYAVHLWAKLTREKLTAPENNTFLSQLAITNCPSIYQNMLKNGIV